MQLETVSLNLVPRFKELTALWTRAALRNMNSVLMGFQSVLVFEGLIVARGASKRGHFFSPFNVEKKKICVFFPDYNYKINSSSVSCRCVFAGVDFLFFDLLSGSRYKMTWRCVDVFRVLVLYSGSAVFLYLWTRTLSVQYPVRTFRCFGCRDEQILPILQRLSNLEELEITLEPDDEGASHAVPSSPTMMCISRMLNLKRLCVRLNKTLFRIFIIDPFE